MRTNLRRGVLTLTDYSVYAMYTNTNRIQGVDHIPSSRINKSFDHFSEVMMQTIACLFIMK